MQQFETSWTSGGVTHTVTTTCNKGETPEECLARHQAAVAAMQEIYPPDNEGK